MRPKQDLNKLKEKGLELFNKDLTIKENFDEVKSLVFDIGYSLGFTTTYGCRIEDFMIDMLKGKCNLYMLRNNPIKVNTLKDISNINPRFLRRLILRRDNIIP